MGRSLAVWLIYGLVFAGAVLMVYNIAGFVRFSKYIKQQKTWDANNIMLHLPIILLTMFLLGYIVVGVFGKPDIIVANILFFGSVFVFIMYRLLWSITRKIIMNEKLEAELIAAEESSRLKSQFLSNMSHELRSPMNVIIGSVTLAERTPGLQPDTKEQLDKIDRSAKKMLGLINNILDMNRLESGESELKNEPFPLAESIRQVGVLAEALCDDKDLTFDMSMEGFGEELYLGDDIQLKNVLLSILNNAAKFTESPGSVSLKAKAVETDEEGRSFEISVSDTGVGIDAGFIDKVFDVFSREDDSSVSRYGGGGMSLAAAKSNINFMGGDISVTSIKGKGSTFTVSLPLKYAYADEVIREDDEEADEMPVGCNVLIAEDMPENAEILEDLLSLEGVTSEHAENGRIAVDMFSDSPIGYYDAVIMDLRMPVMDGLEAARKIRALGREDAMFVPIIALTANAFESDVQNSRDAGMNAHLAKPVDADMLYKTLKKLIKIGNF
ncbi:MAG: response regulator [Mogibacterium sp.]|nr:response regulator [Mogibacterium sp.]